MIAARQTANTWWLLTASDASDLRSDRGRVMKRRLRYTTYICAQEEFLAHKSPSFPPSLLFQFFVASFSLSLSPSSARQLLFYIQVKTSQSSALQQHASTLSLSLWSKREKEREARDERATIALSLIDWTFPLFVQEKPEREKAVLRATLTLKG